MGAGIALGNQRERQGSAKDDRHPRNLTVICFAGGFVVPLLFLLAAFFASTIYSIVDPKPDPPVDAW
ncbi:hypothetical protein [Rhizobium leguminosarum]|uniref:hypothetical protein n=1 Tax=Rhizobium leguminosarum TaxID=384 RepID=UPI00103EF482|nr:hypothetical protein [Rhizobium leguminosarum]MBY5385268.1 hypothetical protein [Rhizobium leguminosarum]MCA2435582.1 hypothetical protein [Rhizobium leguminosarum]NEH73551.1 hypothetical protein [Rhizobium leguminosarum]NKJ84637.1 hypothetical protein [Rhizobium leguminosarum bv. viciae]NKM01032.1 hypothetical protein [Rhizobium leguminosarum bv. viciae]